MSRPDAPPTDPAAPRLKSDLVFGAVAAAALVLALLFFVAGETDEGAGAAAPPPRITVVAPRSGATVSGPFAIVFETPASMVRDSAGWTADGRYHLHATVGGTELMAGAHDVESLGGGRYRWSIPGLPAGEHRMRLQWSGPDHRTLREGGSAPFTLRVSNR